jgi:hypothetical protein
MRTEKAAMTIELSHIDHPVIAVADMENGHELYTKLGFTIPPRGSHLEWGTGNWCIMFADDYLELRGIVDGSRYTHNLDKHLATKGEGLMGLAFAPSVSAEVSFKRAEEAGLKPTGLKALTRRFELPEGDAFPNFRICYLNEAEIPELLTTVVCEHRTPEIIRTPAWLAHENTVTGVRSMTGVSDNLATLAERLTLLVGAQSVHATQTTVRITLPQGAYLEYVTPAVAAERGIADPKAALPYLPAMTLGVADIAATRSVLRRNDVGYDELGEDALRVPASYCCGVILDFVENKET